MKFQIKQGVKTDVYQFLYIVTFVDIQLEL